jgi:polyisoprenoid-binding protein YceI
MVGSKLGWAAVVLGVAALAAPPAGGAETYQVDPVHSSVVFRVKHMNTSYSWGRFNAVAGSFSVADGDPAQCRFEFQVKAASVDTGNPKRDGHLKSPDFLNAVQYPTISFKSRSAASAGQDTYDVTGDLTLHGVTKPVTVKVTRTGSGKGPMGRPIAGLTANVTVKRTDFGMSNMVGAVGDDVWINVSIEGVRR